MRGKRKRMKMKERKEKMAKEEIIQMIRFTQINKDTQRKRYTLMMR